MKSMCERRSKEDWLTAKPDRLLEVERVESIPEGMFVQTSHFIEGAAWDLLLPRLMSGEIAV